MRDFYLWTGLFVVGVSACVLIVRIISRLWDRQRERRYVPPAKLYTEVRPLAQGGIFRPVGWHAFGDGTPETIVPAGPPLKLPEASAWALDALSDARKASADTYATLGEFARRVSTGHAWIGSELEAKYELRRLAVTG